MPTEKEERQHAPETERSYERSDPNEENGQGDMGEQNNTPVKKPDGVQSSIQNDRMRKPLTDDDTIDDAATVDPTARKDADPKNAIPAAGTQPGKSDRTRKDTDPMSAKEKPKKPEEHDPSKPISDQPDHSMNEEEQLGWDQAPANPDDPHRQPRPNDPGGVPKD